MLQLIKRYLWIALLTIGLGSSRGFSLLGPLPPDPGGEPWQIFAIGYAEGYVSYFGSIPGDPVWLGDIGGPHNLGEEYRRNEPVIYYTYDASFLAGDYFGYEGMTNIDGAFAVLNSLTNVDKYSTDLSEFPLSSQEYNYRAQALYLTDLKSITMHLLVEQLGLADAARFTWTLHDRYVLPGSSCPVGTVYQVVQRNFDVVPSGLNQVQYSPYVNGALISYFISEVCSGSSLLAATVPYLTDPAGQQYDPVSANTFQGDWNGSEASATLLLHLPAIYGLQIGGYYTGLTRDDVGGLRYLFRTNNINYEPIPATSLLFSVVTNTAQQQLLPNSSGTNTGLTFNGLGYYSFDGTYGYGDYGALVAASVTNSPAVLQVLYPGLVIASSSNYFGPVTNYVFTQYFTNASGPGTPYPPPLVLVTASNKVVTLQERFLTTFANVVPNKVNSTTVTKVQVTTVAPATGTPYPAPLVTNTVTRNLILNTPSGDFFVVPLFHTNTCPINIIYTGLTNVLGYTNFLTSSATNIVTATNSSTLASTVIQVTLFTNYTFVIHPVVCSEQANVANLYQGIGRTQFKRADFDSLIGQYFNPITNYYTMVMMTNSQLQVQRFVRVVTQPDILIAAQDLAQGPQTPPVVLTTTRSINFNSTRIINGLRGPGVIDSPTTFVYNKVGPIFFNGPFSDANSFLNPLEVNETTQMQGLQWASYDGSTNDPIVYPNGTSVENLEKQMLIQLNGSGPLTGHVGSPVHVQFSVTGGAVSPSFTWLATGYPVASGVLYGLPPGVTLSPDGLLSGTPTSAGTYDFVLTLIDSLHRTVQWNLTFTIN